MSHFKRVCRKCGRVIAQCRCITPNKPIEYALCDECMAPENVGLADKVREEQPAPREVIAVPEAGVQFKVYDEMPPADDPPEWECDNCGARFAGERCPARCASCGGEVFNVAAYDVVADWRASRSGIIHKAHVEQELAEIEAAKACDHTWVVDRDRWVQDCVTCGAHEWSCLHCGRWHDRTVPFCGCRG